MSLIELSHAGAECGAKAHSLGRLIRAGADVPAGFVVLDEPDGEDLARAVDRLGGPLAVRSSGLAEDSGLASFAGQLETALGVLGAGEAAAAIQRCSTSATAPRAVAYAERVGAVTESRVPVIVQRLVPADVAGVAFTREPRTGGDVVVIESAWGLGESVVSGRVIPDTFTVARGGKIEASVGSKATRLDQSDRLRRTAVAGADRRRPSLSSEQVNQIAEAARLAEVAFGVPLDLEWAIAGDALWLLQARPITTTPEVQEEHLEGQDQSALVRGLGASPGRVSGTVRVVPDVDGFSTVQPGDVLVCRTTDPAWTPLFGIVAAVITETGGVLSHAAIVARELGVPAVVGAPDAMSWLANTKSVTVDGSRGIVTVAT